MKYTFIFLTVVICFYLPVKGQVENLSEYRWSTIDAVVDNNGHAGWLDGLQADIDPTNPWRNGFIYECRWNDRADCTSNT